MDELFNMVSDVGGKHGGGGRKWRGCKRRRKEDEQLGEDFK